MTSPAIAARGLEKRFGRTRALRGVDLEVAQGCSLAIVGPNGAGKTTLLRLVAGLSRASGGTLRVAGEKAPSRGTRARVGYIGHATLLYPTLSARENLIFAARLHGVTDPRSRADALLVEQGLDHVAERAAGGFSRGMAQRLSIARGLVHDPPVVLLDEPFTGLDRRSAQRLGERLAALHRDGRTLLLVSHDIARAAQAADRAVVLAQGRILHDAPCGADTVAELERVCLDAADPVA